MAKVPADVLQEWGREHRIASLATDPQVAEGAAIAKAILPSLQAAPEADDADAHHDDHEADEAAHGPPLGRVEASCPPHLLAVPGVLQQVVQLIGQDALSDIEREYLLAARILGTSDDALRAKLAEAQRALVTLVDENRQWFKAKVGPEVSQTPREQAFCAHAIITGGVLLVPDATRDARFSANPLVTGEPHVGFYAGVVLHDAARHRRRSFGRAPRSGAGHLSPTPLSRSRRRAHPAPFPTTDRRSWRG
jgi:GAF domain-containing protein